MAIARGHTGHCRIAGGNGYPTVIYLEDPESMVDKMNLCGLGTLLTKYPTEHACAEIKKAGDGDLSAKLPNGSCFYVEAAPPASEGE